jgi:hypothetical protein
MVAALEAAAAAPARVDRGPWWRLAARPVLARAATVVERQAARKLEEEALEKEKARRKKAREKPAGRADAAMSDADAFASYLTRREQMRPLRAADPAPDALSAREREVRTALAPLWDATPEVIAGVRRFGEAISGVRPADYDPANTRLRERLERDRRRLLEKGDPALWMDEPAALGGFGFNGRVGRYNEDTLQQFRVLTLLGDAALLGDLRGGGGPQTVWQIGPGWGGFAYHLKTLCPGVTYLMTGQSDQLLLSAVYLTTLLPSARMRVYDPSHPEAFWRDWQDVDFAFAPESAVAAMQPPALHFTLDFGALGAMTPERAAAHARRTHDLGCRYVVSLSPIRPVIERFYWPHPVCAAGFAAKRLAIGSGGAPSYFLGWRRLRA